MKDDKKKAISVPNVDPALLARAQQIAQAQDRPLAQVIRELLREFVAENEQKLPQQTK